MCKEFIEKYNFKSKQLIDIIKNNIAYLKKNQIELLEMKITVSEMKNVLELMAD